jgi:hypothetical protein
MPKFKGVLATPIPRIRPSLLMEPDEAISREYGRALTQRLEKLPALAEHYGITGKLGYPQVMLLLVRLASDTVPGFMFDDDSQLKLPGVRKKHDDRALFLLLLRVETLRMEGLDDTTACQTIAADDNPKLAGPANKSARAARGKTIQNLLPKARSKPFASLVAKMIKAASAPEN